MVWLGLPCFGMVIDEAMARPCRRLLKTGSKGNLRQTGCGVSPAGALPRSPPPRFRSKTHSHPTKLRTTSVRIRFARSDG